MKIELPGRRKEGRSQIKFTDVVKEDMPMYDK